LQALPTHSPKGIRLSTADYAAYERRDWLREMIRQEFSKVEVVPPVRGELFNETTIYAWDKLRFSIINSHAISIERPRCEPYLAQHDAYLAVLLLNGRYSLEQNGREVDLQAGDMAIYDATLAHRIYCPDNFSKVIISIPRSLMRDNLPGVEHCTALKLAGQAGMGAVASRFIQSITQQVGQMTESAFLTLAEHTLDLLTMSLLTVRPQNYYLARSRSVSLHQIKNFVNSHLAQADLDSSTIASALGLSARYINQLLAEEDTSLMRYVWQQRLQRCYADLANEKYRGCRVSDIALRWGFNDLSHFSRAFKQRFGVSPRDLVQPIVKAKKQR
jgi:AraC family transcriptional regulator, positive regulator of tynA and feaB